MKTSAEIRYDNLALLVSDAGGLSGLVAKSSMRLNRATLYQILERKQTAGGAEKGIGDELARKIEHCLRLERGWMDWPHSPDASQSDSDRRAALISRLVECLVTIPEEKLRSVATLLDIRL